MEEAVQINLEEKKLYGILHIPENTGLPEKIILMVVGGPQTRIGSHRLYVDLARWLTTKGHYVFRFDYEGIGDSEGVWKGYKYSSASITEAINFLVNKYSSLTKVFIWSLCDGSTASMIYGAGNSDRVHGMILCNPYVHSATDEARALLKHYYIRRIFSKYFWRKIVSFKFNFFESIKSMSDIVQKSYSPDQINPDESQMEIDPVEMIDSLKKYPHKVIFILSDNDLTAKKFYDFINREPSLRKNAKRKNIMYRHVPGADHTFTKSRAKKELLRITTESIHLL